MSRQPMSITSSRTEATAFSSGIRATGRASATATTASKPETRITPLSTSTESKPHSLLLQFRLAQGCTYGAGVTAGGGGSKSLQDIEQKTVGPSYANFRKIGSPPSVWDPESGEKLPKGFAVAFTKMSVFRKLEISAAIRHSIRIRHLVSLQIVLENGDFSWKSCENITFFIFICLLGFPLGEPRVDTEKVRSDAKKKVQQT